MKKQYYLSILALFKNEAHIFHEWLTHYIHEGVDHFYLIDNGSTDTYMPLLRPFKDKITLYYDDTPHDQRNVYIKHYHAPKNETEWLLVIDLDEFVYGNGQRTIAQVLRRIHHMDPLIVSVRIPWTLFGSNGYIRQPSSVVQAFTRRRSYDTPHDEFTKSVFKTEYTTNFNNHVSYCLPPYKVYNVTGFPRREQTEDWFIPVTEHLLQNSELRLNHYRTQSFEFYTDVKIVRGDSQHKTNERCVQLFHDSDIECNDVYDTTLCNKKYTLSFSKRRVLFVVGVLIVLCYITKELIFCVWY